jgi:hypothetical protein
MDKLMPRVKRGRYILIPTQGKEHVDAWLNGTAEDKDAEIEATKAWFREHAMAGRITGGEELSSADRAKTVRKKGVSDGPFAETKEQIGGFIVVEVASEAEAIAMALGWPGLAWEGDAVEVRPVGSSEAEVATQRDAESLASA